MWKRSVLASAAMVCAITLAACNREAEEPAVLDDPMATATAQPTAAPEPTPTEEVAAAQLSGPGGVTGVVNFTAMADGVHMVARVEGATPGRHGFHLHMNGACDPPSFESAGDHFNPTSAPHGAPDAAQRHAGDFGNIEIAKEGTGTFQMSTDSLSFELGRADTITSRAIVVHAKADNAKGNAGAPIACGVISARTE